VDPTAPPPPYAIAQPGDANEEIILPTKSPLFPTDMKALFSMSEGEARILAEEYGIVGPAPATPLPTPVAEGHENIINKLGSHIGVSVYCSFFRWNRR
jgi:hypothetical protein